MQLDLAEDLRAVENVDYVVPFGVSEDLDTLAFQIAPVDGPSEESTVELVHRLLDDADCDVLAAARSFDAILVGEGVRVRDARAVRSTARVGEERLSGASDHLPTLLDVSL